MRRRQEAKAKKPEWDRRWAEAVWHDFERFWASPFTFICVSV
jgi:hypothetical protein